MEQNNYQPSDNAKKRFAMMIVNMAEHHSQDAEHATEYLKSEGIDVSDLIKFITWLKELHRLYKDATGDPEFNLNTKEARKWFDNGLTPYQTFRETYQMENDGE